MTTTLTRFVDLASTPGGDGTTNATIGANRAFASLDDCIAALNATGHIDLITNDEIVDIKLKGLASTPDTDNNGSYATINFSNYGFTFNTDSTRYLIIEVLPANQHQGKFDANFYHLTRGSLSGIINEPPNFTHFRGIQFKQDSDNNAVEHQGPPIGYTLYFERCLFHSTLATTPANHVAVLLQGNTNQKNIFLIDCIFSGPWQRNVSIRYPDNGKLVLYNNVMVGASEISFHTNSDPVASIYLKNNIFEKSGAGVCLDIGAAALSSANNITNDATSPEVGLRNITLTYTDRANFEFKLANTDSSAIDVGTNLSADAQFAFSVDAINVSFGSAWDIGAFSKTSGGGGGNKPYYYNTFVSNLR